MKRKAWICDFEDCGHEWLASGEEPPKQCAKCRRRKWNIGAVITEAMLESLPSDSVRERNRERAERANQAKYGKAKK